MTLQVSLIHGVIRTPALILLTYSIGYKWDFLIDHDLLQRQGIEDFLIRVRNFISLRSSNDDILSL